MAPGRSRGFHSEEYDIVLYQWEFPRDLQTKKLLILLLIHDNWELCGTDTIKLRLANIGYLHTCQKSTWSWVDWLVYLISKNILGSLGKKSPFLVRGCKSAWLSKRKIKDKKKGASCEFKCKRSKLESWPYFLSLN